MVLKSRIPEKYVVVKGAGQSDFGPGNDPWETSAFDIALLDAGIGDCNILKYTSVLPPEAQEITMEEAYKDGLFHHGMVLETIMAQVNGNKGQHLCAGVGVIHVQRNGVPIGGFAAEFEGHVSEDAACNWLRRSLYGIFERRYKGADGYKVVGTELYTKSLVVDDDFGCALVALCFLTFKQDQARG